MKRIKTYMPFAALLALGMIAPAANAEMYDPQISIATHTCPAGSTGYGNARFLVFPYFSSTPAHFRLSFWCSAGGSGTRAHYQPGAGGVFTTWNYYAGSSGVGWPAAPNYGNSFQSIDIDFDGDLDIMELRETAPNTWTVFLNRAL